MTSKEKLIDAFHDSGYEIELRDSGKVLTVTGFNNNKEFLVFQFDKEDDITYIGGILTND